MDTRQTVMSAAAAGLWSLVGLLSGAVLGLSLAVSPRVTVFFAAVGLAIGWFGFSGTLGRINGTHKPKLLLAEVPAPKVITTPLPPQIVAAVQPHVSEPKESDRLSPEEARVWLDNFLLKQQGK